MTIKSRVTIQNLFQQGDKPQGSDYADWLDSFLHLTDASAQSITSPVTFDASAHFQTISVVDINLGSGSINVSGISANTVWADRAEIVSAVIASANIADVSAGTINVDNLIVASGTIASATLTDVSAGTINVDNLIAASAVISSGATLHATITSGVAEFLTVSALTVHVIDYSIHTTVKASTGHASAVPATAAGYIPIMVSGVQYRLVLYNPSN